MAPEHPDDEGSDPGRPGGDALAPDERALLDAFDRLSPQGSLAWGFEDAMRRLADVHEGSGRSSASWSGLPDDLWERGRSARIGQRFVGDVVGVLAELLAEDARTVADAVQRAVGERLTGALDALRYLVARVDVLEGRIDPVADLVVPPDGAPPPPDVSEWVGSVSDWFATTTTHRGSGATGPVVVGESGAGELLASLERSGTSAWGIEPRGPLAWTGNAGKPTSGRVVLGEVVDILRTLPAGSAAGAVLVGAVDRLSLAGQVALVREAVRAVGSGGTVALLTTDREAWERGLTPVERDLSPGRPLHPTTWIHLLARLGVPGASWLAPERGDVHAVLGTVAP